MLLLKPRRMVEKNDIKLFNINNVITIGHVNLILSAQFQFAPIFKCFAIFEQSIIILHTWMDQTNLSLEYENKASQNEKSFKRLKKLKNQNQMQNQQANITPIRQQKQNKFKKMTYRRIFKDLSSYKGQIQGKLRHGFGKQQYSDGSYYVGQFRNGKRNGYGEYKDKLGTNRYWGQYKNGFRDGHGKLQCANKYFYEGDFKHGKFHGTGKLSFLNKSVYQGIFEEGKFAEKGTYVDGNGIQFKLVFNKENQSELESVIEWMTLKQQLCEFVPSSKSKAYRKKKLTICE